MSARLSDVLRTRDPHRASRTSEATMLSTLEARSEKAPAQAHSNNASQRRAADWLLERIQKGRKAPFTEIVTLTPEIAEVLLANNQGNRNIKQTLVELFVADIEGGRWDLNGETIVVSQEGILNDGQHRCTAVVQCGKSIRTAIMFGVSRDSRYTVDAGSARTAGDYLKMEGATNVNHAAAVAKYLNLHRRGYTAWNGHGIIVSKVMIRQEYWDNEKEIQTALHAVDARFSRCFGISALATAYVLIARRNAAECGVFFQRLADGVGLKRNDPILALRNRIMEGAASKATALKPELKVEMVIRCWNAWRRGASIHLLRLNRQIPKIEA